MIGYVAPGAKKASEVGATTNFAYDPGTTLAVDATSGKAVTEMSSTVMWGASNKVALNDCAAQTTTTAASANWNVAITANTNGNSVSYTSTVTANCVQLTPSFDKIGK